jgi:hypothetical protein
MENQPSPMSLTVSSVLSGLGINSDTTALQAEVNQFLASLGYQAAVCGPIQWGCLVIYATPQEAAMLRFDLSPVADFLSQRDTSVRDIRVKVL